MPVNQSPKQHPKHHSFVFRFYTLIVIGLIVIAAVLDYGFGFFQATQAPHSNPWVEKTLVLIEDQLSAVSDSAREAQINRLEHDLALSIRLIPSASVISDAEKTDQENDQPTLQAISSSDATTEYLYHSPRLKAVIHIKSAQAANTEDSLIVRFIPPLFYLSILILVGIWFRPLLRDLDLLTRSAASFAKDYRQPLTQLKKTSALSGLANSFANMASKVRNTIQGQKDLSNALSHELRTPLARIKFALAILSDEDTEKNKTELASIRHDIEDIDKIIAYMLNYARLDHFETQADPQNVPIDEWMGALTEKHRSKEITLETKNLSQQIMASLDPHLMELAVSNLLSNACRYTRKKVLLSYQQDKDYAYLAVEDDGEGILKADREKVFDAYTRLDTARNREKSGFGLGLAVAARIAELHNGSISIEESELGGAKFVIKWRHKLIAQDE